MSKLDRRRLIKSMWVSCVAWGIVINILGLCIHSFQEAAYQKRLQRAQAIALAEGVGALEKNLDITGDLAKLIFYAKNYKDGALSFLGLSLLNLFVILVVIPLLRRDKSNDSAGHQSMGFLHSALEAVRGQSPLWGRMLVIGPGLLYVGLSLLQHNQKVAGPLTMSVCFVIGCVGLALWKVFPDESGGHDKQADVPTNWMSLLWRSGGTGGTACAEPSRTKGIKVEDKAASKVAESALQWVLRPDGKIVGPYTAQRINTYLSTKRVPPGLKVSESKSGPWKDLTST